MAFLLSIMNRVNTIGSEATTRENSMKRALLEVLQNSKENTRARVLK